MHKYAELEIGLHRWDSENYAVELRFTQSESESDVRLVAEGPPLVQLDNQQLLQREHDDDAYGQYLSDRLFSDPSVTAGFLQAKASAESLDVPLRVRLYISSSAKKLHGIRWEALRDPEGKALVTNNRILFSRYVTSLDFRPVRSRKEGSLTALIVLSDPKNLDSYRLHGEQLTRLAVEREAERVSTALGSVRFSVLSGGGQASLHSIISHLRLSESQDAVDVLYLVCHGGIFQGQPRLLLEDEDGNVSFVAGSELVDQLRELASQPRLVVLASCESGGSGSVSTTADDGAMSALGPRLAEAGVAAVLAMQGRVAIETVQSFMPVFFRELDEDGQVDRAVAVARRSITNTEDNRAPVLFLRLRTGRLWYVPGLDSGRQTLNDATWNSLLDHLHEGHCTPIIGAGLAEPIIGSRRELAQRWVAMFRYPMIWDDRNDLSQVAQFLASNYDHTYPRYQLDAYLRREISARHSETSAQNITSTSSVEMMISEAGRNKETDSHRLLALLPCPIYITTEFHDLMRDSISSVPDRHPEMEICRWNHDLEQVPLLDDNDQGMSVYDRDASYRPTQSRPLVYHLFGHLRRKDSLVLTEDDYFDYLIGLTSNKDLIPVKVRRAMVDSALLFIGFQINEWSFRVLFRSLMAQEGRSLRKNYSHVAVQIDPELGNIVEPELARRYLERYFGNAQITIFWGTTEMFVKELSDRWHARYGMTSVSLRAVS